MKNRNKKTNRSRSDVHLPVTMSWCCRSFRCSRTFSCRENSTNPAIQCPIEIRVTVIPTHCRCYCCYSIGNDASRYTFLAELFSTWNSLVTLHSFENISALSLSPHEQWKPNILHIHAKVVQMIPFTTISTIFHIFALVLAREQMCVRVYVYHVCATKSALRCVIDGDKHSRLVRLLIFGREFKFVDSLFFPFSRMIVYFFHIRGFAHFFVRFHSHIWRIRFYISTSFISYKYAGSPACARFQ